jgi:hypothetical protein
MTNQSDNLLDSILEDRAHALAKEIDREVMWSMLEELGWQRVILPILSVDDLKEIETWVEDHVTGAYENHRTDFIFEDDKDAMWFKLRWLS